MGYFLEQRVYYNRLSRGGCGMDRFTFTFIVVVLTWPVAAINSLIISPEGLCSSGAGTDCSMPMYSYVQYSSSRCDADVDADFE